MSIGQFAPETFPTDTPTTVTVAAELKHLCPFVNEADNGRATITWATDGASIELHSLSEYLGGFTTQTISHEALTHLIEQELEGLEGIAEVTVTTHWVTAGMDITCSTSPTPAARRQ